MSKLQLRDFTDERLAAESTGTARKFITHPDKRYPGLTFVIHPNGKREWIWRRNPQPDGSRPKVHVAYFPAVGVLKIPQAYTAKLAHQERVDQLHAASPRAALTRRMTVGEYFEHYCNVSAKEDGYSEETVKSKKGSARKWFVDLPHPERKATTWRDVPLQEVLEADVLRHFEQIKRVKNVDTGQEFLGAHRAALQFLRKIFRRAVVDKLLDRSPLLPTEEYKLPTSQPRERVLSADEIHKLLDELAQPHIDVPPLHRLAFQLKLLAGCRRQELSMSRWKDIQGDKWHMVFNKKKHRNVTVPITPQVRVLLNELHAITGDASPYLFPGDEGPQTHVSKRWLNKALDRFLEKRLWLTHFTPHDLRRTVETTMRELGTNPVLASHCTGHRMKTGASKHYDWSKLDEDMQNEFTRYHQYIRACRNGKGNEFIKAMADFRRGLDPSLAKSLELGDKYGTPDSASVTAIGTARARRK